MTAPPQGPRGSDQSGPDVPGGDQSAEANQQAWQQPGQGGSQQPSAQSNQDAWQHPGQQAGQDAWQRGRQQPDQHAWQQPGAQQHQGIWQQPGQGGAPQHGHQAPAQYPGQQYPGQQHPAQQQGQQPGGWQQPSQPQQHGGWQQPGQRQAPGGWQQPGQQGSWPQQQGQPHQGQPQQQAHGGWGQTAQLPAQGDYQQQPWEQPGGWQQQQWQPPGGGDGGGNKKLLFIGGGVAAVLVLVLLVIIGVRALGGDDNAGPEPTNQPTSQGTDQATDQPTGQPTANPTGLGNASGQAKAATDGLAAAGFECNDLFNTPQGSHRGCFKNNGATDAEAIFQFSPDGTVIGMQVRAYDSENHNTARKIFDAELAALGGQAFGSEVAKVQAAVNSGDKSSEVKLDWGELRLTNDGDSIRLTGGKTGVEALDVPRKQFDNNETAAKASLKAKGYQCPSYCKKGGYGSGQASAYIHVIGSSDSGLRSVIVDVSGDGKAVTTQFTSATGDLFGILKGDDVPALQAWVKAHLDGKSHSSYVNGWRVDLDSRMGSSGYGDLELEIKTESYYV